MDAQTLCMSEEDSAIAGRLGVVAFLAWLDEVRDGRDAARMRLELARARAFWLPAARVANDLQICDESLLSYITTIGYYLVIEHLPEIDTMQAIQTKFLGPTNSRGDRVKATCAAGTITVSWEFGLGQEENHIEAAKALIAKLGWQEHGEIVTGTLADGSFVHVFAR